MRDYSQKSYEEGRPSNTALHCVNFCLQQIYADNTKDREDEIVHHLTFEEVIGALLLARDKLEELE